MTRLRPLAVTALLLLIAAPARADITGFIGANLTPTNRQVLGGAFGIGLLVIGFEGEYAFTPDDPKASAPSLTTGMGNVLLQTPRGLLPVQLYATVGAGAYRARYEAVDENDYGFGTNVGGGAKIELIGPLRLRVDYRVFNLSGGDLVDSTPQRIYVGANLAF